MHKAEANSHGRVWERIALAVMSDLDLFVCLFLSAFCLFIFCLCSWSKRDEAKVGDNESRVSARGKL